MLAAQNMRIIYTVHSIEFTNTPASPAIASRAEYNREGFQDPGLYLFLL